MVKPIFGPHKWNIACIDLPIDVSLPWQRKVLCVLCLNANNPAEVVCRLKVVCLAYFTNVTSDLRMS